MKKFNRGLRKDEKRLDQPEGSWVDARNIVVSKANGSPSNENGFDNITPLNYPKKSFIGGIITNTKKIHFFAGNTAADSEIGSFDENFNYTPILIDAILNFDINHPIQGTFEYKFNNDLVIAWTDSTNGKWNPIRILNIDCLPFAIDINYHIVSGDIDKAKALISLFPNIKSPTLSDFNLLESGGNLTTGVYFPIVGYTLADGSDTSWISIYNPISIVADSKTQAFLQYDGNLGGVFTGKALDIVFTNVDTNFKYLKFGYIKLEDGVYTAQYVNSYLINGTTLTIEFTDNEISKEDITLDDIIIPNSVYPYAKTITSLLNKLFIANLETEPEVDYQPYANNIQAKWIYEQDIKLYEPFVGASDKNEKVIFFNKGFKSDEVYALYIGLRNKVSGKWSKGFTLPGRTIDIGDNTDISGTDVDIAQLDLGNPIPKFRVLETVPTLSMIVTPDPAKPFNANNLEGEFGFWENEVELYPDVSSFDSTSVGGIDIRGQNVRHHKFPSMQHVLSFQPNVENNGVNYVENRDIASYDSITYNASTFFSGVYSINLIPTENGLGWLNNTIGNFSLVPDTGFLGFPPVIHNQVFYFIKNKLKIKVHLKVTINSPTGNTFRFFIYKNAINYFDSGVVAIPVGISSQNMFAEIDIEDKFQTGVPFGGGYLENYSILIENLTADPMPTFPSIVGGITIHDMERSYVTSKVLGIKISNVEIPPALLDIYDEWGIFYAKRTPENIRAIGNDMYKVNRLHTFDLMQKQVATKASYLKTQIRYFDNIAGNTLNNFPYPEKDMLFDSTTTVIPKVYHIRRFEYAGENTNINGINNTNLASNIYIEAGKSLTTPYSLSDLDDAIGKKDILFDLMIYKKNVYNSFQNQELVFTGQSFKIIASGIQPIQKVYGGDIFNTFHGFLEANITNSPRQWSIQAETASNIGFRMDDEIGGKYYYPKHLGYEIIKPTVSYYGYNNDYSALNDLQKVFPATFDNNCFTDIFLFPQRVAYSLTEANESSKVNWRIFKINDYYEMPKDKGVIWNILGNDRILYIHHEYTLFIAQIKDRLNTSGEETYLGISDLFDRPPAEILPVKEGYAGNTSQFATFTCKLGYCFVDRNMGRFFIYNEGNLQQISNEGLINFCFDNVQYSDPTKDNPFIGMGYTMAFDEESFRLVICKKDDSIAFQFTISFSSQYNYFISFHDYLPHYIYNNREGIFYIDNINNRIFKGGSQVNKGIFIDGVTYPSYIDKVFNESGDLTKRFQALKWLTEVEDSQEVKQEEKTFTHIIIYNNNQCSGLIPLKDGRDLWFGTDRKNIEETWQFNNFRDLILNPLQPFLDKNNALIGTNIDPNKSWYKRSRFLSKFIITRFQYDNQDQEDIYFIAVEANYIISTKGI